MNELIIYYYAYLFLGVKEAVIGNLIRKSASPIRSISQSTSMDYQFFGVSHQELVLERVLSFHLYLERIFFGSA